MKTTIKYLLAPVAIVALALAYISTASAHAELVSSTPAAGSTVTESPATVSLTFDSEIQKVAGSYALAVTDANGASVTSGAAAVSSDGMSLSVALQPDLEHGVYTVSFTNTSAEDGDELSESFTFTVGEAAAPGGDMPEHDDDGHADEDADHAHEGDEAEHADESSSVATTGLVVIHLAEHDNSGVDGRAEILSVDGGARTQIGVYVNGIQPGSAHMTHVHMEESCGETPGPHAAELSDTTSNGVPYGGSVTTVDVPFATVVNGEHTIRVHAGATGGDKATIACGEIPNATISVPVSLPSAGAGQDVGKSALPMLLLGAGFAVVAGGVTVRRVAAKV